MTAGRRPRVGIVLVAVSKVLLLVAVMMVWPGAGAARAIVGSDTASGFTARLQIGDRRVCSGVLVHPLWLLTAKSCFADGDRPVLPGPPPIRTTLFAGNVDLATEFHSEWQKSWVVELVPHPDRDVVLAELAWWEDSYGIGIATTPPRAGETLWVSGFGRTGTEWVPDTEHTATFTVDAVNDTHLTLMPESVNAAICKGDAGGPAFRQVAGRAPELVAIHHTSWQAGCYTETETRRGATETRVDDLRAWIATTTTRSQIHARDNISYRDLGGKSLCYSANGKARLSWTYYATGWSHLQVADNVPNRGDQFNGFVGGSYPAGAVRFQSDGNLVVTNNAGTAVWSSKTWGHPDARLVCEDDGGVTIYDGSRRLWQSGTAPTLYASANRQVAHDPSASYRVLPFCFSNDRATHMQAGEGFLRSSDGWRSPHKWHPDGWTARFQSDGNLVTYDGGGTPMWSSRTSGHPNARLVCNDDGNVAIYDGNTKLWDTASRPTGRLASAGFPGLCAYTLGYTYPITMETCSADNRWTRNPDKTIQWTEDVNKCLLVVNGTGVRLEACAPTDPNMLWRLDANGSLVNPQSGKCLHATSRGIVVQACNGSTAQRWSLQRGD